MASKAKRKNEYVNDPDSASERGGKRVRKAKTAVQIRFRGRKTKSDTVCFPDNEQYKSDQELRQSVLDLSTTSFLPPHPPQ